MEIKWNITLFLVTGFKNGISAVIGTSPSSAVSILDWEIWEGSFASWNVCQCYLHVCCNRCWAETTCQRYLVGTLKDSCLFQYIFLPLLTFSIKSTTNCIIGDSGWSLWWIGNRLNTGFPFPLVANSDVISFNDPYLSSLLSSHSLLKHLSSALFCVLLRKCWRLEVSSPLLHFQIRFFHLKAHCNSSLRKEEIQIVLSKIWEILFLKSSKECLNAKTEDSAFGCAWGTNNGSKVYSWNIFPVTSEEQLCPQIVCFLHIFVHSDRTGTALL